MSSPISEDILDGHLGHLSADQAGKLEVFKAQLVGSKLYTPVTKTTTTPGESSHNPEEQNGNSVVTAASHDDSTLLRFLRARNWDTSAAQEQFSKHEEWLKKHNVRQALNDLSPQDMLRFQKFYPRWTGRRDKLGIPVFVYRVASLGPIVKDILAHGQSGKGYQTVAALTEFMTLFHLPLCSHLPHPNDLPISSTVSIVDLGSASFSLLWQLRSHFQEASRLNTDNYPETISRIAIVNAPSFFHIIWNWLKTWFDKRTQSKIIVLGKDPGPTLCEFIDPVHLPRQYGGELDWEFEDEPHLDQDTKRLIGEMPIGPVSFVDGKVAPIIAL